MGRRKIEIQPITHERNRSVTFLKRKNGLFKKAYELGVLCSVDVAVIIFEERPGHEMKLHSYSSGDLREIVQRQIRFQGERDGRGPGDFSGAGGAGRFDDGDDNDDMDEDDEVPARRTGKRKAAINSATMGLQSGSTNQGDYLPQMGHRNGFNMGQYEQGPSSSLMPVSNDRVSNLRSSTRGSKRARTENAAHSRSPSPDRNNTDLYLPGGAGDPNSAGGRMFTRSMRTSGPTPVPNNLQGIPNQYGGPPGYGAPQQPYGGLFPLGDVGAGDMGPPGAPQSRFEPQYDPALYQQQYPPGLSMVRQSSWDQQGPQAGGGPRERGGGEMFAAFLEADERSRQMAAQAAAAQAVQSEASQRQQQQQGLNWPTAGSGANGASAPHTQPSGTTTSATSGNWFDLFSGATPVATNHAPPPPPTTNATAASTTAVPARPAAEACGEGNTWPRGGPPPPLAALGDIGANVAQILAGGAPATGPVAGSEKANTAIPSNEKTSPGGTGKAGQEESNEVDAEGEEDVDDGGAEKTDGEAGGAVGDEAKGQGGTKDGKGRQKKAAKGKANGT